MGRAEGNMRNKKEKKERGVVVRECEIDVVETAEKGGTGEAGNQRKANERGIRCIHIGPQKA